MIDLENLINTKLSKIEQYNKINKGKSSAERSKKELFLYNSSEDLINVKQKQLNNMAKANNIVENDICKINDNLKKGYYLDKGIKIEKPSIKTKEEELN